MAGDHCLLVGLGDSHRVAEPQLALLHQHGVAQRQKLGIRGQPVRDLKPGDLSAAVEVIEMAPLLAGGQPQGEAGGQVAGPIEGGSGGLVPAGPRRVPYRRSRRQCRRLLAGNGGRCRAGYSRRRPARRAAVGRRQLPRWSGAGRCTPPPPPADHPSTRRAGVPERIAAGLR